MGKGKEEEKIPIPGVLLFSRYYTTHNSHINSFTILLEAALTKMNESLLGGLTFGLPGHC